MDYRELIDSFRGVACVVSLVKDEDGNSNITIASANKNYLASVNKLDEEFVPGRPYTYYISEDTNFEALVESCITKGKISHHYVNADLYNAWLDLFMIPLNDDEDGNGYCLFTYEMNVESDSDRMINISAKTAYMVLKTCIKFRENFDFKETMDSIVRDIRNQCESDGCAIILMNRENRKIDICCFDKAGGDVFAPEEEDIFFKPEFYDIVEGWRDIMSGSNCFIITDETELREVKEKDENWYNSLVLSGVTSLVLYPLRVRENLYGYIFATNFNSDKTPFIREVMELNSFILSAEVENFRMRQKLEKLSTTDLLTGVLNRNAMNVKMQELERGTLGSEHGLGAVFVDLNGLKVANDSRGHDEGDVMLRSIADKLKSVYGERYVYRVGGDEFLVVIDDMDRDEFFEYFKRLEALSDVPGEPTFALGAHYDDEEKDLSKIIHTADQNMYRNKAKFYENNPQYDRREGVADCF